MWEVEKSSGVQSRGFSPQLVMSVGAGINKEVVFSGNDLEVSFTAR